MSSLTRKALKGLDGNTKIEIEDTAKVLADEVLDSVEYTNRAADFGLGYAEMQAMILIVTADLLLEEAYRIDKHLRKK